MVAYIKLTIPVMLALLSAVNAAWGQQAVRSFESWDRDNSGQLTRDELPAGAQSNFDTADTDGDGFISLKEHTAFLQRDRTRRRDSTSKPKVIDIRRDIPYAGTLNPRQMLDLVLPKRGDTAKALPVVAFIHGGAWQKGDKRTGINRVARLVESGDFAGVSIAYRLTGESQWPAQIHDCKAAIRWLKAHAAEYGLDPERICVYGTSAGGHLAAMLGVTAGIRQLEGDLGPHTDQDSRVAAVIDFFGPTDFLTMNDFPGKMDHDAADSPESLLIGGAIQQHKEQARAATPVRYVSSDDAAFLIMHGTKDPLVPFDQSVQFHRALQRSEVESILIPVAGGGHGFRGRKVDECVDLFLRKVLLGKDVSVPQTAITPR